MNLNRDPLSQNLGKLYQNNQIASFFIMNGDSSGHQQWLEKLLAKFISIDLNISIDTALKRMEKGVSDLIIITPDGPKYTIENGELAPLFEIPLYNPIQLKKHIIVVKEADKIGDQYLNKALKTLEDQLDKCIVFFVASTHYQFMPTIRSRAVLLRPESEIVQDNKLEQEKFNPIKTSTLWEGIEWIKNKEEKIEDKIRMLLNRALAQKPDGQLCNDIASELQWVSSAAPYNSNENERYSGLIRYCADKK